MNCAGSSTPIDLEAGLRIGREQVMALRQSRKGTAMSLEEYLDFLQGLENPSITTLRARRGPRGDSPFEL
jgi:hypothetical protein